MTGKKPVFVVFEGLDGAGKSTCARLVADALDAFFLTTPSPRVREYRDDLIATFAGCQEAAQLFYLATVFAASEEARRLLAAGQSVVLDRYFLSTQAYAAFRGSVLAIDAAVQGLLLPAGVAVFLEAPLDVRVARLSARGTPAADRETLSPDANARLLEEHLVRARLPVVGRFLRIDSAVLGPCDVVQEVLSAAGGGGSVSRSS